MLSDLPIGRCLDDPYVEWREGIDETNRQDPKPLWATQGALSP